MSFDRPAIDLALRALADQIAMPWDQRQAVETRLHELLADGKWKQEIGSQPIQGVIAYHLGEGGLIIKVKKGTGRVRFLSGEEHELVLKGVTAGAQVGGSSEWGVGLIVGLPDTGSFGGSYQGTTVSAGLATLGTGISQLTLKHKANAPFHSIYLVSTASGATANAGGGALDIVVKR